MPVEYTWGSNYELGLIIGKVDGHASLSMSIVVKPVSAILYRLLVC